MKIGTLGPEGTYSDLATQAYGSANHGARPLEIVYYATIGHVFDALSCGAVDEVVVPIENTLAGFVQPVLDGLANHSFTISQELLLPIKFSCVTHCSNAHEITHLLVQPVALGQCETFVSLLNDVKIVQTASNIDSSNTFMESPKGFGAIIPFHTLDLLKESSSFTVENVTDGAHNETRFIVVNQSSKAEPIDTRSSQKASLIIRDEQDHAGILHDISRALAKRNINMLSIISRPTRAAMGKYYFFIDIEIGDNVVLMEEALAEIRENYAVQLLGNYAIA